MSVFDKYLNRKVIITDVTSEDYNKTGLVIDYNKSYSALNNTYSNFILIRFDNIQIEQERWFDLAQVKLWVPEENTIEEVEEEAYNIDSEAYETIVKNSIKALAKYYYDNDAEDILNQIFTEEFMLEIKEED